MAWVRIDDQFYDHPRWATAPGDSIALWLAAMAWCNRNDSFGGFIPSPKLAGLVAVKNVKATCTDLVQRGAFTADNDGYWITSYEEYQQNERVKAIREARSEAGKKGAKARWKQKDEAEEMANAMANGWQLPWQTDGNGNAPLPTTRSVVVEDLSTGGKHRRDECLEGYASVGLEAARKRGTIVGHPNGYKRKLKEAAMADPELDRLLELFPDAPASVIVAAMYGDKGGLRYYQRADEVADVVELRSMA